MHDKIRAGFDAVAPTDSELTALYGRILLQAEQRRLPRRGRRWVLMAAAAIALLALLSTAGYAAYQRWFLPEPTEYVQDDENPGIYHILETNTYTQPLETEGPDAPLSDSAFLQQAAELLDRVGLQVDASQMTVVRQENLYWDRTEAEVRFDRDEIHTSVTYNADTGALLAMSGIDWVEQPPVQDWASVEELARRYYALLPVPQDYVLQAREEYDPQFWSFDFCREAAPGIYSYYEMVRISVNPVSGRLTGVNVFSVPLLDDHTPADVPLTQDQAEAAARALPSLQLEAYELKTAVVTVGLPNWSFTQYNTSGEHLQVSKVTRLCWVLRFERPNSDFADEIEVLVDYYTGEILGGDVTG